MKLSKKKLVLLGLSAVVVTAVVSFVPLPWQALSSCVQWAVAVIVVLIVTPLCLAN